MEAKVNQFLNPVLRSLGLRALAKNPDAKTPTMYAVSMDGNGVENWLDDLAAGLVDETPDRGDDYALKLSNSTFLRAVAQTYEALGMEEEYGQFVRALDMLTHWVRGMRAAMKMKPEEEDLGIVKRELALYVVSKLERAAGRVTWYDHLCLFTVGEMMEQWGSLRLISQEGMEGCQKKLNEILRLNNGFANAGAIPKWVKRAGKRVRARYMAARAALKPSPPRWVFEQSLIQQHAQCVDLERVVDMLKKAGRTCAWSEFTKLWQRYMVCAAMRCRLRARLLLGKWRYGPPTAAKPKQTLWPRPACARVRSCLPYYEALLQVHNAYSADVSAGLSAPNLDEKERKAQERTLRRKRYAELSREAKLVGVNPREYRP